MTRLPDAGRAIRSAPAQTYVQNATTSSTPGSAFSAPA